MERFRSPVVWLMPVPLLGIIVATACSGSLPTPPAATLALPPSTATPLTASSPTAGAATPALAPTVASPSVELQASALVQALQAGGYVIFIRHAATDMSQPDTDRQNLANCDTQRNLSDQGRADSRAIGQAFQALGIPVGPVLASEYCRTRETAELAFGRAALTRDLTALPSAPDETERQRRIDALREILSTPPPSGTNTILVSHLFNIQGVMDISLVEGEAAIYRPRGEKDFVLVGSIEPDEWAALTNTR